MSGFLDLGIKHSYTGKGSKILQEFLLPLLCESVSYDRVTSFYTIDSLVAISQGIDSLYGRGGSMRLIIGVHSFPPEMAEAELRHQFLEHEIERVRLEINHGLAAISDELIKRRVATLAWMVDDGLLQVRVASAAGEGLFHPKTLIFGDGAGNKVAAVGSSNETQNGLGANFEQLMVATSWDTADAVQDQEEFFESLWSNKNEDAIVEDLTSELAESIVSALGPQYAKPRASHGTLIPTTGIIANSIEMPANFFVSGAVPALFQHQERAVIDALSRWPVRVLFADEVGLGKTFEVAATIAFLMRYGNVKRAVILTPKSVLQQWQDELSEHFGMQAWLYDSAKGLYISPEHRIINMGRRNPIGKGSPDIMLISAQYARGGAGKKDIFQRNGAILPDLLALDEAHSARVRRDISGSPKSTRMYGMVRDVSQRIPHVILATATPMQKDSEEYHSMLKLLGLPKAWQKPRAYLTSLRLIAGDAMPDTNGAYMAGKLLHSTIAMMKPSVARLTPEEAAAVSRIDALWPDANTYEVAQAVQADWDVLRPAFIKLHPARLLTVRNTRRSLEQIGYEFPKRNLNEESIDKSDDIQLFYDKVYEYISTYCFSVEKVLYPGRKLNTGFIRISYRQRVASSLFSCQRSLTRRLQKMSAIKSQLISSGKLSSQYAMVAPATSDIDAIEEDELLLSGMDVFDSNVEIDDDIDYAQLTRAIELEITSLTPLIKQANDLVAKNGDMKVERAIAIAMHHLKTGDKVLVFSRYTDTVEALVKQYERTEGSTGFPYGIFIGQKSVVVRDGAEHACSKDDIKLGLRSGEIAIMFCSDAASEGLNLQAARVLINVDVPWTPARLEQRIGRIARLGQVADEVDIYNVWYPASIEARMYHRIQQRLEQTNLAVGEFPDVVADDIRYSIIEGTDDNSLASLQEIRNSDQTKSLELLWSSSQSQKTSSDAVRDGLLDICKKELAYGGAVDKSGIAAFKDLSGQAFQATNLPGYDESISYQTLLEHGIDYSASICQTLIDETGMPHAFSLSSDGTAYVEHEDIPALMQGRSFRSTSISTRPKMLPKPDALDLAYAIVGDCPAVPSLWIGDDNK